MVGRTADTYGTVSFGRYSGDPDQVMRRHPAGRPVTVYYDPLHLAVAVLEPGTSWESYGLLIASVVFIAVGIIGVISWYRVSAG